MVSFESNTGINLIPYLTKNTGIPPNTTAASHIHTYTHTYVHTYVHVYKYIHTQHMDRQIDKHTDR